MKRDGRDRTGWAAAILSRRSGAVSSVPISPYRLGCSHPFSAFRDGLVSPHFGAVMRDEREAVLSGAKRGQTAASTVSMLGRDWRAALGTQKSVPISRCVHLPYRRNDIRCLTLGVLRI
jgi:hypothetical protein